MNFLESLNEAEFAFANRYSVQPDSLKQLQASRRRSDDSVWHQVTEWIVAPVLAGFVDWVAAQGRADQEVLYFCVMREGRLLSRLLKKIYGVQAPEVWFNRNISMLAAFGCGDDEALVNWLVRTRIKPMTKTEATRELLGKNSEDSAIIADAAAAQQLMNELKKTGELDALRSRCRVLADRLTKHWLSVCKNDQNSKIYLIDFASAGNIQRSLQTVFASTGITNEFIGLNFAMTSGARFAEEKGCVMRGYLAHRGEPAWFATAMARTPELMEIFAASPVGSLRDYDAEGRAQNDPTFLNETQQLLIEETQDRLVEAAAYYHQSCCNVLTPNVLRCIWGRFMLQPTRVEANTFARWPLDAGLDGTPHRILAAALHNIQEPWTKLQTAWPAGTRKLWEINRA